MAAIPIASTGFSSPLAESAPAAKRHGAAGSGKSGLLHKDSYEQNRTAVAHQEMGDIIHGLLCEGSRAWRFHAL